MKIALRLQILIYLLFPLAASAVQIEIKGVALGASEAEVKQRFPWAECEDNKHPDTVPRGDRNCLARSYDYILDKGKEKWESTFGGAYVKYFAFDFYAGKLHRVTIGLHPNWFDDVIETLTTKYGKPKDVSKSTMQNRMGATFINQIYTWRFGDDTIHAQRYGRDLDSSFIEYSTDYADQEYKRRQRRQVRDKTKDL
jgi:hypothetical protein